MVLVAIPRCSMRKYRWFDGAHFGGFGRLSMGSKMDCYLNVRNLRDAGKEPTRRQLSGYSYMIWRPQFGMAWSSVYCCNLKPPKSSLASNSAALPLSGWLRPTPPNRASLDQRPLAASLCSAVSSSGTPTAVDTKVGRDHQHRSRVAHDDHIQY